MLDEGYIKFNLEWRKTNPDRDIYIEALNQWRTKLHELGLIGQYPDNIGYGNISMRIAHAGQFIITGTQTGHLPVLKPEHYCKVTDYSIEQNRVTCEGPVKASSEALTHAMLYACDPEIRAVMHVHHREMWERYLHQVPTTDEGVPYGTPEMGEEMLRLYRQSELPQVKFLAMAGHEEGLIAFGSSLEEAGEIILARYREMNTS